MNVIFYILLSVPVIFLLFSIIMIIGEYLSDRNRKELKLYEEKQDADFAKLCGEDVDTPQLYSDEYFFWQDVINAFKEGKTCAEVITIIANTEYKLPLGVNQLVKLLRRRHRREALQYVQEIWLSVWIQENIDIVDDMYSNYDMKNSNKIHLEE